MTCEGYQGKEGSQKSSLKQFGVLCFVSDVEQRLRKVWIWDSLLQRGESCALDVGEREIQSCARTTINDRHWPSKEKTYSLCLFAIGPSCRACGLFGQTRSKSRNSDFEVSVPVYQAVGYLFRFFLHSWLNDYISCSSIWTARCSEMRPVKIHNVLLIAALFFLFQCTCTHQVGSDV